MHSITDTHSHTSQLFMVLLPRTLLLPLSNTLPPFAPVAGVICLEAQEVSSGQQHPVNQGGKQPSDVTQPCTTCSVRMCVDRGVTCSNR